MAMNKVELDKFVKQTAIDQLAIGDATRIDDYSYAIEVPTENGVRYAKIAVTACLACDTKRNKAFNLESAVAAYAAKVTERETKAAETAARKAAKTK